MKLLFDQNLSHKLVSRLTDLFPESAHVRDFGMEASDDKAVWTFAAQNGFTLVSKDDDFHRMNFAHGAPPKVIALALGNCSTAQIETLIRWRIDLIRSFETDPNALILSLR